MQGAGYRGSLVHCRSCRWQLLPGWNYLLMLGLTVLFGVWLCGKVARELLACDHEGIVWDDSSVSGSLSGWCGRRYWMLLGFVVFRVMDILDLADQLGRSTYPWRVGIMLDDILAGVAAWAVMQGLVALLV